MTTGSTSRDDAELEAFLARQSSLSADYDNLELVEPPAALDEKILGVVKAAAKPAVTRATPAPGASSAIPPGLDDRRNRPRPPRPETDDDDDDDVPPPRRPRWLVPTVAAVSALVVAGVGLAVLGTSPSGTSDSSFVGSLFAKRARERSEADKAAEAAAAAAAAEQEAEVIELDAAPLPPPVLGPGDPQVRDLEAAIALIRKELVLANQTAAIAEEAAAPDKKPAAPAGKLADTVAAAAPVAAPSVVQPRERRLTKILELYDDGNPDLAADSLEIFLRDFEDDPLSQRILNVKP